MFPDFNHRSCHHLLSKEGGSGESTWRSQKTHKDAQHLDKNVTRDLYTITNSYTDPSKLPGWREYRLRSCVLLILWRHYLFIYFYTNYTVDAWILNIKRYRRNKYYLNGATLPPTIKCIPTISQGIVQVHTQYQNIHCQTLEDYEGPKSCKSIYLPENKILHISDILKTFQNSRGDAR